MKQSNLVAAAVALVMPFAVAVAQTPPTPPATPVRPAPQTAPLPVIVPATPPAAIYPDFIDRDEIRRMAEDARIQGQMAAEDARRIAEDARWQAQAAVADMHFNVSPDFGQQFRDFGQNFRDFGEAFRDFHVDVPNISVNVPQVNLAPMAQAGMLWTPGARQFQDPADSAYEVAWQSFNRQDYSRAAAKFAEMIAKFPNSRRVSQAAYYQAFALYRVGTLESLRSSLKVLESNTQQFQYSNSSFYRTDVPALQARVLRALAERNEPGVDAKLRDLIAKYPKVSCDEEKISIQSQVLNSLYQTDPDAAMPYIQQYLKTRDACTAELRKSAIFLLANRGTADNTGLIVDLARSDTVRSVRLRAIEVLSRMPGDAAITALQQFMNDEDEQVQAAAVRSLMRSDNPKARAGLRQSLIDKRDAPERQRVEAIRSMGSDNMSPDDAAYLRGLFSRAGESDNIKQAVVSALASVPTEENMKFLLDVAQNPNESSSIRSTALRRVTARQNLSTDNLIKLYDATDNRSMRNSLVDALAQRPEQAAVNKLLDIVKNSTDPEVRSNAIQELLRKNDKAITQKVLDLIK
jgi:HEAT repeat protein